MPCSGRAAATRAAGVACRRWRRGDGGDEPSARDPGRARCLGAAWERRRCGARGGDGAHGRRADRQRPGRRRVRDRLAATGRSTASTAPGARRRRWTAAASTMTGRDRSPSPGRSACGATWRERFGRLGLDEAPRAGRARPPRRACVHGADRPQVVARRRPALAGSPRRGDLSAPGPRRGRSVASGARRRETASSRRGGGGDRRGDVASARTTFGAHASEWVEPVRYDYRGVEVCELPPTAGAAALLALALYDGLEPGRALAARGDEDRPRGRRRDAPRRAAARRLPPRRGSPGLRALVRPDGCRRRAPGPGLRWDDLRLCGRRGRHGRLR